MRVEKQQELTLHNNTNLKVDVILNLLHKVDHFTAYHVTLVKNGRQFCNKTESSVNYRHQARGKMTMITLYDCSSCTRAKLSMPRTRDGLEHSRVRHLTLPDAGQDVLHSLGAPQEVKHSQVDDHTRRREHLVSKRSYTFIFLL